MNSLVELLSSHDEIIYLFLQLFILIVNIILLFMRNSNKITGDVYNKIKELLEKAEFTICRKNDPDK